MSTKAKKPAANGQPGAPGLKEFDLAKLHGAKYNPHAIGEEALAGLTKSLERFGCVEPIVVNIRGGRNRIVGGHSRRTGLLALGVKRGICVTVDLSDADENLLNVTLNNPQIQGQFTEALGPLIDKLRTDLGADSALLDLRINELAASLPTAPREGRIADDEVPEPPKKAVTKTGDLWLLGEHRLLCGDSQSENMARRATNGKIVDLTVSSPPYNVNMKYNQHNDKADRVDYLAFIEKVAKVTFSIMGHGRFVAWNIGVSPNTYYAWQIVTFENVGFTFYRQIVWEKRGIPFPIFQSTMRAKQARHYKPNYKHEMVIVVRKGTPKGTGIICPTCEGHGYVEPEPLHLDDTHEVVTLMTKGADAELGAAITPDKSYENDIWHIPQTLATVDLKTVGRKPSGLEKKGKSSHMVKEHPSAFPVQLPVAIMSFLSATGEIVYEPFIGSGSTIIAAEKLDRKCYGLEIDPKYCDVIVERWEAWTGKKGKRIKA
jgi:DNA modification methylase